MTCVFDYTVSICGRDEIRLVDNCKNEVRQKIVAAVAGLDDIATHWTYDELQDIGCFLHDAPEFKTQQFEKHKHLIVNLGYVLTHEHDRHSLVKAMLFLMNAWFEVCTNDQDCIAPPSRAALGDKQQLKILSAIDGLAAALERERYQRAVLLQQQTPNNLTPQQQATLVKFEDGNRKRTT